MVTEIPVIGNAVVVEHVSTIVVGVGERDGALAGTLLVVILSGVHVVLMIEVRNGPYLVLRGGDVVVEGGIYPEAFDPRNLVGSGEGGIDRRPPGLVVTARVEQEGVLSESSGSDKSVGIDSDETRVSLEDVHEVVVGAHMAVGLVGNDSADIGANGEVLAEVNLNIGPECVLVVLLDLVIEARSLGPSAEGKEVTDVLGTAGSLNTGTGLECIRTEGLFYPVGVRIEDGIGAVAIFLDIGKGDGRIVVRRPSLPVPVTFVVGLGVGDSIEHLRDLGRAGEGSTEINREAGLSFLSLLCGDEDDTVCSTGSVDSGRCVLQDGDALDIIRVQTGHAVTLDTVDDVERGRGTESTETADMDGRVVTSGLTGTLVHDEAGETAFKGRTEVRRRALREFIALDSHDGSGQCLLLVDTISDHHGLLQLHVVKCKGHVDVVRLSYGNRLGEVAEGRELEDGA